jgi:hypothetical protein
MQALPTVSCYECTLQQAIRRLQSPLQELSGQRKPELPPGMVLEEAAVWPASRRGRWLGECRALHLCTDCPIACARAQPAVSQAAQTSANAVPHSDDQSGK